MKEAQKFISESEATQLTGLSSATLKSFIEAGYLKLESDADGVRLYSHEELIKLFGAPLPIDPLAEVDDGLAPAHLQPTSSVETPPQAVELSVAEQPTQITAEATPSTTAPAVNEPLPVTESTPPARRDAEALKIALEVQEKLLESKDRELTSLREERSWLRQRIEKLEEKGARDQVILLSETQAIREMVQSTVGRRSTMRSVLEFLGFMPVATQQTIEVARHTSGPETASQKRQ